MTTCIVQQARHLWEEVEVMVSQAASGWRSLVWKVQPPAKVPRSQPAASPAPDLVQPRFRADRSEISKIPELQTSRIPEFLI